MGKKTSHVTVNETLCECEGVFKVSPCPQCSASCGGGVQRRLVKCVNLKSDTEEEEEHAQCDHESCPENTQKCNIQECENITFGKCTVCSHLHKISYPTYKV